MSENRSLNSLFARLDAQLALATARYLAYRDVV